MEECTFAPKFKESAASRAMKAQLGDRSVSNQTRINQEFQAKKQIWIQQYNERLDL